LLRTRIDLRELNVGPLKDGVFEAADNVTLIMGPPNTGKSYLLRTLHLMNWYLDEYTAKIVFERAFRAIDLDISKFLEPIENGFVIVIPLLSLLSSRISYALRSVYSTRLPEDLIDSVLRREWIESIVKSLEISSSLETETEVLEWGEYDWSVIKFKYKYRLSYNLAKGYLRITVSGIKDGYHRKNIASDALKKTIQDVIKHIYFDDTCFMLPYDKDLLTTLWEIEKMSQKGLIYDLSIKYPLPPMYYSFLERLRESYAVEKGVSTAPNASRVLDRLNELKKLMKNVAEGTFSSEESWIAYETKGVKVRLARSSGLAISVASLIYTLATLNDGALVLVEEPEVALHPEAQVKLALMMLVLSKRYGYKFVIVTHSPYIYKTYALLKEFGKKQAEQFIKTFNLDVKPEELLGDLKLYYAHDGKLEEVSWSVAPGLLDVELKLLPPEDEEHEL